MGNEVADILIDFLVDPELVWTSGSSQEQPVFNVKCGFLSSLWSAARDILSASMLQESATRILSRLREEPLEPSIYKPWSDLVADLTVVASPGYVRVLLQDTRTQPGFQMDLLPTLWEALMIAWASNDGTWDDAAFLLAYPFQWV